MDIWGNPVGPQAPDATVFPLYEDSIDERFPRHFDDSIHSISTEQAAAHLTENVHAACLAHKIPTVDLVTAQFGEATSPPFFMMHVDVAQFGLWDKVHDRVLRIILNHLGHLKDVERPILRYLCEQGAYMDHDFGDFS